MGQKKAFRPHIRKIAAGDATDILRYPERDPVPSNQRHHITLLSFEDETSNCTEVQISAGRLDVQRRIAEQIAPAAGRTYFFNDEIVLTDGERLQVYFSGATALDVLDLWLQGYWVEVIEDA